MFLHIKKITTYFHYTVDYNFINYRNDPKFSDRYAWANSVDLDQTAPLVQTQIRLLLEEQSD